VTNLRFQSDRRGELRLNGDLGVTGEGRLTGRVGHLEIISPDEGVRWVNRGPIRIERDKESWKFTGLLLESGTGRVSSDIFVKRTGELFVRAEGSGVDLAVFSPFLLLPEPLGGMLDFQANAIVGADTLSADVDLLLRDGRYGEDTLELVEGNVRVRDDRIVFDDLVFRSSFATASLNGDAFLRNGGARPAPTDSAAAARFLERVVFENLEAEFESPDFDRVHEVFPAIPSPGGRANFRARLGGSSEELAIEWEAALSGGRLGVESLDSFAGEGSFHENVLDIRSARIESRGGTLDVRGRLPLAWSLASPKPRLAEGPVELDFVAERLPARAISAVVPLFELTRGRVQAKGRLAGDRDDLHLEGDWAVEEGVLAIPTFDDPLVQGVLAGKFDREGVEVTSGSFADDQGGRVTGRGRVELHNLGLVDIAIQVEATDYHYSGIAGIRGVGDGRLSISVRDRGERKIPEFTGAFRVARLDLDERVLLPPDARSGALETPPGVSIPQEERPVSQGEPPPAVILAKLDFAAGNNVWLRTEEMNVEMAGDVTLHVTEDYVGLSGLARSLRGTYSVLNTEFDIEKGELEFNDPADITTSYIDAVATTHVGDEDITALVTGPLVDPVIDLQSESGLTAAEIYELLLLRRDATSEETEGPVTKAFRNSVLTRLANQFGRDIVRELGFDTFDLEVEGERTNLGVGKRFTSDFFVKYTQQVHRDPGETPPSDVGSSLEGPERQLLLEYRLSEIFQLQVEQGKIAGEEYLNGDLWAEWGY
jgi:hypothetical protein